MILVIDCGLSTVKAVLATREGEIIGSEREPYPTLFEGERAEQSPADWWTALAAACERLPDRRRVSVIVVTGHMHAAVLLDEHAKPLLPCLTLHDRRGDRLLDALDPREYHTWTGQVLDGALPLAKLLWLRDEDPRLLARARALLAPKDYLCFLLSGRLQTDPIDAAGTGLYSVVDRAWSEQVLRRTELPRELLVPVEMPTTQVGKVLDGPAVELGLTPGTAVLAGAGDDIELLGATAYDPRAAVEHAGTTGAIVRATNQLPSGISPHVELSPTATSGTFAISASMANVGSVFAWIRDQLELDPAEALAADALPSDPIALPYLLAERGPSPGAAGTAMLAELQASHGRREIARAMLAGVALLMDELLTDVEAASEPVEILYTSGGWEDPAWLSMRAAAHRRPLVALAEDPTMLGCIAVARAHVGQSGTLETLATELRSVGGRYDPDPLLASTMSLLRSRQQSLRAQISPSSDRRVAVV